MNPYLYLAFNENELLTHTLLAMCGTFTLPHFAASNAVPPTLLFCDLWA